jgi:hypothetical protein
MCTSGCNWVHFLYKQVVESFSRMCTQGTEDGQLNARGGLERALAFGGACTLCSVYVHFWCVGKCTSCIHEFTSSASLSLRGSLGTTAPGGSLGECAHSNAIIVHFRTCRGCTAWPTRSALFVGKVTCAQLTYKVHIPLSVTFIDELRHTIY